MADIGATLREARIRARIDMSEVETRTKIRAKYLRAIENEEWDLLPGPVYAKSFLRTYGDYLGLDSRMLVEEYKRRYEGPTDHEPPRPVPSLARERERERERGFSRPRLPQWTPIALVLVAIVVVLYLVGTIGSGNSNKGPATTPSTASTHHARHHAKNRHVALPTTRASATLQMTPTGPVYVCLVNGAGKRLIFEKTYAPGQPIPTFKQHKMLLTLGNANVQVKVNGKLQPIAASSTAIRLLITPTTVEHILPAVKPTCP
jgi:cytoskeleton protein RodZ